jgi:hypothetical protein
MLLTFLKKVLPNEGVKCWTSIRDGKAVNHFCLSFEELADQIRASDAQGIDTYHACASYQNGQNRRGGNVALVQSFWMDIDVGEGKPYAKIEDAISACDQFCDRLAMPVPGMVRSGGGLHAYWPLDRPVTPAEWLPAAQRLKLLAQTHGLLSSPSDLAIIADIARILRPPETHNYKIPGQPRPVTIDNIDLFEPVSYAELTEAWLKAPLGTTPQKVNNLLIERTANGYVAGNIGVTASNNGAATGSPHAAFGTATGSNNVFSAGISKAFDATKGVVQGSRGAHRIRYAGELVAKGHPPEEVLAKLLVWDALCQPPEGEAACIHSMKSAFSMHAARHPSPLLPDLASTVQNIKLPHGFGWGTDGALVIEVSAPNPTDKSKPLVERHVVSKWPLYLKAQLNHEGYMDHVGYLFMQYHSREGWKEIIMSSEEMNGDKWYSHWYKRGGEIMLGQEKYFKSYVRRAGEMLRDDKDKITQHNQFGWKNDDTAFLVGEFLCKSDGTFEKAYGTLKMQPLMQAMRPAPRGCLQAWSAAANKLFMPGLEPHAFALLCSFASVLMKFVVDQGNGGSIVSLVSEKSGTGKTPATIAAASVWGDLRALVDTGNFTENRLIEDLVRHNHLPVMREEMPYSDPQIAADGVKKFTSGSDRGRLDRSGAASGIPESYQNILISVSNKSFHDLVAMADAPMARRIFEIDVPRAEKEELENIGGIAREMMLNCGHAGMMFVRFCLDPNMHKYIEEHLQGVNGKLGSAQIKYRERLNSSPEHRFIVWVITCVDVAARILQHTGMLNFNVERMMSWVVSQAVLHIDPPMEDGTPEIKHLTAFLNDHTDCSVVVQTPFSPGQQTLAITSPKRKILMRMEMKPPRLYISNTGFKDWCTRRGISFISLSRELAESKIALTRSKPVTLTAGTNIPGGRELCLEIDMGHPAMTGVPRLEDIKSEMIKQGAA